MNKLYCSNTSCAKPNFYESAKPKFCAHCGGSFSSGFTATASQPAFHAQVKNIAAQPAPQRQFSRPAPVEQFVDSYDFSDFKLGVAEIKIGQKLTLGGLQQGNFAPESDRPIGSDTDAEKVLSNNIRKAKSVTRDFGDE